MFLIQSSNESFAYLIKCYFPQLAVCLFFFFKYLFLVVSDLICGTESLPALEWGCRVSLKLCCVGSRVCGLCDMQAL